MCVYKYICVLHAGCKKECKPGPPDDKKTVMPFTSFRTGFYP